MELIYVWAEEYRTFKNVEINLSNKFIVKYNQESSKISIRKNKQHFKLYPEHISNINVFLGKNSTGKSNLIDLIGMKIDDRNSLNEEFETIYKRKKPGQIGYKIPDDIEEEKKKAKYFFLYHLEKDENGVDIFCLEGNDIDSYIDLFENKEMIDTKEEHSQINYWREKYWFAFVCTCKREKLFYKYNVQGDGGLDREQGKYHPTIKDKLAIVMFRESYNATYYKYSSFKSEDDYKIAMPRRIAYFNTKYLYKKIELLIDQMQRKDKELYLNSSYTLSIKYNVSNERENINISDIDEIAKDISNNERSICRILSSFCFFFIESIFPNEEEGTENERTYFSNVNKSISNIKPKGKAYKDIKAYYYNVLKYVVNAFFKKDENVSSEQDINHFWDSYNKLEVVLEKILNSLENGAHQFKIIKDVIHVIIDKDSDKQLISELIMATIDERIDSDIAETYSVFVNFFDYRINFLSDGELAYLGIMASLDEQISLLTQVGGRSAKKEKYILLIDEPEIRMHPELARTFIKTLIVFLSQYKNKIFQLILVSHSPFLVSDIPKTNIFTITKDEDSLSWIEPCELDTFGQNIHSLLKNTFFMNFTMGEYARDKIEDVKKFLNSKIENDSYISDMTIDEAEKIIDLIGETVLKTALQGKLKTIKTDYSTPELKDVIVKYDNLSPNEKKQLIEHIISFKKSGE